MLATKKQCEDRQRTPEGKERVNLHGTLYASTKGQRNKAVIEKRA